MARFTGGVQRAGTSVARGVTGGTRPAPATGPGAAVKSKFAAETGRVNAQQQLIQEQIARLKGDREGGEAYRPLRIQLLREQIESAKHERTMAMKTQDAVDKRNIRLDADKRKQDRWLRNQQKETNRIANEYNEQKTVFEKSTEKVRRTHGEEQLAATIKAREEGTTLFQLELFRDRKKSQLAAGLARHDAMGGLNSRRFESTATKATSTYVKRRYQLSLRVLESQDYLNAQIDGKAGKELTTAQEAQLETHLTKWQDTQRETLKSGGREGTVVLHAYLGANKRSNLKIHETDAKVFERDLKKDTVVVPTSPALEREFGSDKAVLIYGLRAPGERAAAQTRSFIFTRKSWDEFVASDFVTDRLGKLAGVREEEWRKTTGTEKVGGVATRFKEQLKIAGKDKVENPTLVALERTTADIFKLGGGQFNTLLKSLLSSSAAGDSYSQVETTLRALRKDGKLSDKQMYDLWYALDKMGDRVRNGPAEAMLYSAEAYLMAYQDKDGHAPVSSIRGMFAVSTDKSGRVVTVNKEQLKRDMLNLRTAIGEYATGDQVAEFNGVWTTLNACSFEDKDQLKVIARKLEDTYNRIMPESERHFDTVLDIIRNTNSIDAAVAEIRARRRKRSN